MDLPPHNPGGRITGMGDSGGELFSKRCCYFYVASEGLGGNSEALIGRSFGTLSIEGFNYVP